MAANSHSNLKLYARLLRHARPYWRHFGALFFVNILATPLALLLPLPLKIVVDSGVGSEPLPGPLGAALPQALTGSTTAVLALAAGFLVAITLLDQLQKLASSVLGTYTGEKLILSLRTRLFGHVQRLSLAYHDSKGTADSIYRIHSDAAAIQWIVIYGATPILSAGFMLIGMLCVTARIDWQLALVGMAVAPLIFVLTGAACRRLRRGWEAAQDLESTAHAVLQEVLTALRVVKAFGQEDREQTRFVHRSGEGVRARIRMAFVDGGYGLVVGLATGAGTALVLFIGGRHIEAGLLTLGDLMLVMGYLAQLYLPVQAISKSLTTLQSSLSSAARALALLDEAVDVVEKPNARPLARAAGAVSFRNVSFTFGGERFVLRNVTFDVPPGTRLGIAGTTGAGKTTLVSLLARFYDPTTGRILLDGVDLDDYKVSDLRAQFSIVLQEPILFSTTIAENIAYARPEASPEEIITAAKAANAHEFIRSLPDGYDTRVGERGMRLSGGERQRIALARAFLKDAPILILDEPTSSVDIHTEAEIMQAMERLMQGRTTFMIAHRLTTLANCDVLLEVCAGRVSRVNSVATGRACARVAGE